jgi:N-methylhydantoinase A/oxoprolinase/acetone carboxylase beta subunit
LDLAIHATTLVTNAIIERRGARTALLTTEGFRDVLEIGTGTRYDPYDYFLEFRQTLVPRRDRKELPERVLHDGSVAVQLDDHRTRKLIRECLREGVEAFAVCLLHSVANPVHEIRVRKLIHDVAPEMHVSISSDVVGEVGELERFSTTVANAYVQPIISNYVRTLAAGLGSNNHDRLYMMLSSGSTASTEVAEATPIQLVESGPAAGALGAAYIGKMMNVSRIISFDMGGTTAKACLIEDGMPSTVSQTEVARVERFKRGSGIPLKIPVVDLIEIGAGGGSIAYVDSLGLLKVGPQSAGANPGPACYGLGGTKPTVTDANLVLGYLGEESFLGGRMRLDREAARAAIRDQIGVTLGIDETEAAFGILDVVNENMAQAAQVHIAEKNRDARHFSLIAFGGAGPAHAREVAKRIHVRQVIVPIAAGALSALGLLVAPLAFEHSRSIHTILGSAKIQDVQSVDESLRQRGIEMLKGVGVIPSEMNVERWADMRYEGQIHQIRVAVPFPLSSGDLQAALERAFEVEYERNYSRTNPDYEIELLAWRVRVSGQRLEEVALDLRLQSEDQDALREVRPASFRGLGLVECPVYDHYRLRVGAEITGPAIVEQRESTCVIGPADVARTDQWGNLMITVG